jgi:hypothetical protein
MAGGVVNEDRKDAECFARTCPALYDFLPSGHRPNLADGGGVLEHHFVGVNEMVLRPWQELNPQSYKVLYGWPPTT